MKLVKKLVFTFVLVGGLSVVGLAQKDDKQKPPTPPKEKPPVINPGKPPKENPPKEEKPKKPGFVAILVANRGSELLA